MICNRVIILRDDRFKCINNKYVYYYIREPKGLEYIGEYENIKMGCMMLENDVQAIDNLDRFAGDSSFEEIDGLDNIVKILLLNNPVTINKLSTIIRNNPDLYFPLLAKYYFINESYLYIKNESLDLKSIKDGKLTFYTGLDEDNEETFISIKPNLVISEIQDSMCKVRNHLFIENLPEGLNLVLDSCPAINSEYTYG